MRWRFTLLPVIGTNDRDLISRNESRFEKRETLDMVPMRMSDEEVRIQRFPVCNEMVAQTANAVPASKMIKLVVVETEAQGRVYFLHNGRSLYPVSELNHAHPRF